MKNVFNLQIRNDLKVSTDKCEDIWVEVNGLNKRSVIFGVIYRHPGSNIKNFQKNFEKLIFNLNISKKPVYITGDLNVDYSDGINTDFKDSISSLGYHQFVDSPTRYNLLNNSSSIIDHFYSNQPQNSITVKVLVSDLTDHNPLRKWIKKPSIKRTPPTKFSRRDMNSFSSEDFVDDLGRKLNSLTMHDNVNVTYDAFINTFMSVLNDHAPLRECTRRDTNLK